jgi:hypothetical protein
MVRVAYVAVIMGMARGVQKENILGTFKLVCRAIIIGMTRGIYTLSIMGMDSNVGASRGVHMTI